MLDSNQKFSEQVAVAAAVRGVASTTPLLAPGVPIGLFRDLQAIFFLNAPTDAENVIAEIGLATAADGTGFVSVKKPVTLGQTYTLVAHATNNDGKIITIDFDKLDIDPEMASLDTYTHIVARLSTSGATGDTGAAILVLGGNEKHAPTIAQNALNTGTAYKNRDDDSSLVVLQMR